MTLALLVNAALRMLLVGAVAWLALRALRVRNPHIETLVWRMLLLASLALPWLLLWRIAPTFVTSVQLPVVAAMTGAADFPAAVGGSWPSPTAVAVTIYLAVALLLVARLAVGLVALWRIGRAARPCDTPDDVRITSRLASPATFGGLILLPEAARAWPAAKLDAVLHHERAHVRAHDGQWSWLASLHAAVFWFNPLAWWLRRRLDALAEIRSDEAVVAARHDPVTYAALLLEFACQPNARSVVMSVAESNVPARIERLLKHLPPAAALSRFARGAAFVALIPIAFLAASTTRALAETRPDAAPAAGVVRIVKAADPDQFYPEAAKDAHVTGKVIVKVAVDGRGQLVDVQVLETQPAGDPYGFGAAAMQLARGSTYSNSGAATSTLTFMVKFALTDEPPAAAAVKLTRPADPDNYYPEAAKLAKVAGEVTVQVAVDPEGQVVDVRVLATEPASDPYGFGAAAIQVARNSKYSNPNAATASMKFKVKFAAKA